MSIWCSDIDGVLIDSKALVRESYKAVGIDMPIEAWGHPWQTWLPAAVGSLELAKQLHNQKTDAYIDVLLSGAVGENALPFAQIARALERDPVTSVYYVTGATNRAAVAILRELGLNPYKVSNHQSVDIRGVIRGQNVSPRLWKFLDVYNFDFEHHASYWGQNPSNNSNR
jgi:phosphoglycolate phosphatase-like HAD superfamily hydrolase